MRSRTAFILVAWLLVGIVAAASTPASAGQPAVPAFPGAEGFGARASGGRGGDVYIVTTLEPFGEGSLGDALQPSECGPRIVVFEVSGVIEGNFDLLCGNITIAGQTAPGAGITVRGFIDGYSVAPEDAGNIIIRHVRFRPGTAEDASVDGENHDAVQLDNNPVVILDHISAAWATDEVIDLVQGTENVTVQWSTIEESRIEGHPEGAHNYGMVIGEEVPGASIHHNLFAHQRSRSPAVATGPAEVVNNVVYDGQDGFVHHQPAEGEFHIVGNLYRRGPYIAARWRSRFAAYQRRRPLRPLPRRPRRTPRGAGCRHALRSWTTQPVPTLEEGDPTVPDRQRSDSTQRRAPQ